MTVKPPEKFEAYQNFPNPFNPQTAISYQLPAPSGAEGSAVSRIDLKVYNVLGQVVATLVDGDRLPGYHQEIWDARQTAGGLATRLSSGVYIYRLVATDEQGRRQSSQKRMLLIK